MRYLLIVWFLCILSDRSYAQTDSVASLPPKLPVKYLQTVDKKMDTYSARLSAQTEKTLVKLSKWENKIHELLVKVNPAAAQNLFGNNQATFTSILAKLHQGEALDKNYRAQYDEYENKVKSGIDYIQQHKDSLEIKNTASLQDACEKMAALDKNVSNSEVLRQFIQERKKQLFDQSIQYIGNNKYLQNIAKENYYYVETLKNYKEIFHDSKKAEETAITILNKIPAFSKLLSQNALLARMAGNPSSTADNLTNLAGLQTRSGINALIQNQIAAGGPNAQEEISRGIQSGEAALSKLENKMYNHPGTSDDPTILDFKPDNQKTRTFLQRLVLGTDFQTTGSRGYLPATADIALSAGYKINDKSVVGVGTSYKIGLGSDISHMKLSSNGIGLRSFIDWKLKKQIFISGGYEMNYNTAFRSIEQLNNYDLWQSSALIGLSKKINVRTRFLKGTNVQLLYDMLSRDHMPVSQPVIFRLGYAFH